MKQTTMIGNRSTLAAILGGAGLALAASATQAGPTWQFGDEGSLTFTYSMQGWAQHTDYSAANEADDNDLFLRRNRATFSGQMNDMIGYYVQFESHGNPNADADVRVRDAYLTIDYKDELRFIVGEFKNTFSRENLEACHEPLTLDRSELLAYTPFGGTRDTGVAVWGNLLDARLQYRFMIAEGRDDKNAMASDSYRYTARVHYSLLDPEFNYGYLGTYLGTQKVFTVGAAYDYQANIVYANYPMRADPQDYKAWTVDAFFEYPASSGVYTLAGAYYEFDSGDVGNKSPDPFYPINGDMKGYTLKAGYMLPNKVGPGRLQFFVRHDKADYGVKTGLAEYFDRTHTGIGANYYLDGQKLKLTVQYADVSFDTPHPVIPQLQDFRQVTLGLQFIF